MSFLRFTAVAAPLMALTMVSCGSFERVDARYPTAAEMDRLDVQWGLAPRKSRGAPRRTYQYTAPPPSYREPAPTSAAPSEATPTREVLSTPPPSNLAPEPSVDSATINRLR